MTPFEIFVLVAWFLSFVWFATMVLGYVAYRWNRKYISRIPYIIVQITTIGNDTVNQIIDKILAYDIPYPFEIWVVTEPLDTRIYPKATRTIVVPTEFKTLAKAKSRALEYARQLRINSPNIPQGYRVLYLDDDSVPSKEFVLDCFHRDFDILEGVIESTNHKNTFWSFMDVIRTQACLTICAFAQSISRPVWVHGESTCIGENVDRKLGWDRNIIASEDMVYGHLATSQEHFKMRFTYARVNITAPLNAKDFVRQRRRWIWGNLHAIRCLLPIPDAIVMGVIWAIGFFSFFGALIGMIAVQLNWVSFSQTIYIISSFGLVLWFTIWGTAGYAVGKSFKSIIMSAFFSILTVTWNCVVQLYVLTKGPIKKFDVIEKKI